MKTGLLSYRDLVVLLVQRDIKLKYRRSFLGYLWSILNPLFIMIVMAIVFSYMFSRNIENYPLYLFTGQLLFNYMSQATNTSIVSITTNGALLKKTYVPKYIFTLAKVTSCLVDFFFSLGALALIMIFTGAKFSLYNLLFWVPALQLYCFTLGLGMFLAQANVFFRDTVHIYGALITGWMYLTPIFYPIDMLPEGLQFGVKNFNAMYFYVAQFRSLIYENTMFDFDCFVKGCFAAILMLTIGVLSFKKSENKFILYI